MDSAEHWVLLQAVGVCKMAGMDKREELFKYRLTRDQARKLAQLLLKLAVTGRQIDLEECLRAIGAKKQ